MSKTAVRCPNPDAQISSDRAGIPGFIPPMLAIRGQPFDSDDHLFEVKWDGIRALAFVERDGYRLVSRGGHDLTHAFPELAFLAKLPPGTVLDGELVVLVDGKPRLSLVQARKQLVAELRIHAEARSRPATYVAFDQLYHGQGSIMARPLWDRREILRTTASRCRELVVSEGVVGPGKAFYERVIGERLEGVMAKRLERSYRPGRRSDAWIKIKPTVSLYRTWRPR